MSEFNKSYRIRTEVGKDTQLHVKLEQKYNILEIMSLKINQESAYKLHGSNYGVIAGRVLANDAFGIPNAKISVFIPSNGADVDNVIKNTLYPYNSTNSKNKDNVRYNLLFNEQINNCHTVIGTFPEKQYLLDNDSVLEVFKDYYKYTTRTNNAGDYMIFGVPTGTQTIHVDIDLSDIGILSQKPRDMVYKGYNINQFENPNKFKYDTNLDSLAQVISQDNNVNVIPFWGDESENIIGVTRCDINIQYKFEPTCVFMGSIVTDDRSNGISKKCIPTPGMGAMDELTTGSGTIEMIRKTPYGGVEEFQIQGTQLINGDGVWCYQIPMNLDYVMTDEFGNTVPTNDPKKGIPTRTKVRFRVSLQEFDNSNSNIFPSKILIPHNPEITSEKNEDTEVIDFQFGSKTKDSSFRDLFWNGVYSVKSYIPRIQKGTNWKNEKFTGFKRVNYYGDKNPIPYNNIRIRLPFNYRILCSLIKLILAMTAFLNKLLRTLSWLLKIQKPDDDGNIVPISFISFSGELCNDNLENLCLIPGINLSKFIREKKRKTTGKVCSMLGMTAINHEYDLTGYLPWNDITKKTYASTVDTKSIDGENYAKTGLTYSRPRGDGKKEQATIRINDIKITEKTDYLIQCVEMNLAQEFRVIQFDFYNDWINGLIYIPRWMRNITKKRTYLFGLIKIGGKTYACNENFSGKRNIVQQCGLTYKYDNNNKKLSIDNYIGCGDNDDDTLRCHKRKSVRKSKEIFNGGGVVRSVKTMKSEYVYYFKPTEGKVRLFSTDIILLGSLNDCDKWGIPNSFNELTSSTYQMPPNLALTDSQLEGSEYEAQSNGYYLPLTITYSTTTKNNDTTINIDKINLQDYDVTNGNPVDTGLQPCYGGINPMAEEGDYTEISGIDWGYSGPLQDYEIKKGEVLSKLYKPGGHFLGLTCRHSATSIKTCVNLTRICEYGVWMSQRQTIPISKINLNENELKTYSTVPSGIISKDEISDSDYRRHFASMNKNRLRTVIDKTTGYPVYDFEYVNPTNFAGELNEYIFTRKEKQYLSTKPLDDGNGNSNNDFITDLPNEFNNLFPDNKWQYYDPSIKINADLGGGLGANGEEYDYEFDDDDSYYSDGNSGKTTISSNILFNRVVVKNVTERQAIYNDDDFYKPEYDESSFKVVSEPQIMRVGEYTDSEYVKFRFGTDNLGRYNFLINETIGNTTKYSFPVYDNSFYFYFGLHDGKTALDVFKELYYAKCDTKNILTQSDYTIAIYDIKTEYQGVKEGTNSGSVSFKINAIDDVFGENGLICEIKNNTNDESIKIISGITKGQTVSFENLSDNEYQITLKSDDGVYENVYYIYINKISLSGEVRGKDFLLDAKNKNINDLSAMDRFRIGGYITINGNVAKYESGPDTIEEIDIFKSNYVNKIIIEFEKDGKIEQLSNDVNNRYVFQYGGTSFQAKTNLDNIEYIIPVPYSDMKYSVYVETFINNDGKIHTNTNLSYKWYIGDINIKNGRNLSFTYNGVPFGVIKNYIKETTSIDTKDGWWNPEKNTARNWTFENPEIKWKLKSALYKNDINSNHKINIVLQGGVPLYYEKIVGNKEIEIGGELTGVTRSDLYEIKIPTINYRLPKTPMRRNFGYVGIDSVGQIVPETPFIIPVIYKPFFMELLLLYFNETESYYLNGNVYNGKTWEYTMSNIGGELKYNGEGFNNVILNGVHIPEFTTIEKPDHRMEIVEPFTDDTGGYDYGISNNRRNNGYFKYNGRKTKVNRNVSEKLYGLYPKTPMYEFGLSVGCIHTEGVKTYSDSTNITLNNLGVVDFKLDINKEIITRKNNGVEEEIEKTYIKMIPDTPYTDNYTLYILKNGDEKEDGCYEYSNNSISEKLFRHIIDDEVKGIDNISKRTDGYIDLDDLKDLNIKEVYYIALYQKDDNVKTTSSVENKLKGVSISKLININELEQ